LYRQKDIPDDISKRGFVTRKKNILEDSRPWKVCLELEELISPLVSHCTKRKTTVRKKGEQQQKNLFKQHMPGIHLLYLDWSGVGLEWVAWDFSPNKETYYLSDNAPNK
jgi:hypothetical protein